ncbi:MAG: PaaI family thioesterase [Nocardioides sp.]|nr:PaaI family thioesterase [Nocardioides sp.]
MTGYILDEATTQDIEREQATYGPIAEVLRELAEVSIRTEVAPEVAAEAVARLREVHTMLSAELGGASYGTRFNKEGFGRPWGNAVVGVRNPVAPPLDIQREDDGRIWADFVLGPQYEGPPTLVHGGVSALLLDQLLGEAAAHAGSPGMTGTLTIRYRRGTPLGKLHGEAKMTHTEGVKSFVSGHIADAEGVCVEAEGVFILPRWARGENNGKLRFD